MLKEPNNRKLAGVVVSALAETYRGTPQGEFWLAYSQLEAKLHELSPGGLLLSLKAQASILYARLLPEKFIGMLNQATQT